MGDTKQPEQRPEDVIAAFDRERDEIQELTRRHTEQIRSARAADRTVQIERRRRPR